MKITAWPHRFWLRGAITRYRARGVGTAHATRSGFASVSPEACYTRTCYSGAKSLLRLSNFSRGAKKYRSSFGFTCTDFFTARRCTSAVYAVVACPSVCPSVIRRCCVKTTERIEMGFARNASFHLSYCTLPCGWLGSRVVSVLDSGAVGPGFKSQPQRSLS